MFVNTLWGWKISNQRSSLSVTTFLINKDFSCFEREKQILIRVAIYTSHFIEHGLKCIELRVHARAVDIDRADLLAML